MGTVLAKVMTGEGDDDFIIVEVRDDEVDNDHVVLASRQPGKAVVELADSLDAYFQPVIGAIGGFVRQVRSMPNAPDHAEIQFGLRLGGEAGLIVARASAEASFQITVSWDKPEGE